MEKENKSLSEKIEQYKKDIIETEHQQDSKYTDGALIAISKLTDDVKEFIKDLEKEYKSYGNAESIIRFLHKRAGKDLI